MDKSWIDMPRNTSQYMEKIEAYESTNTSSSQTKETSSSNSLALALGSQEHCGRVCGLGLGPCPSKLFGIHGHCHSGSSSTSPSYAELQTQVSSLTSQVNEMKAMMTFMLQNYLGEVLSRFNIFQPSPVFDQESMPNEEENEEQD